MAQSAFSSVLLEVVIGEKESVCSYDLACYVFAALVIDFCTLRYTFTTNEKKITSFTIQIEVRIIITTIVQWFSIPCVRV